MINNSITFKSKFGYIFASEHKGGIYSVKFGKAKINNPNKTLYKFKKEIIKFFMRKSQKIRIPYKIEGSYNQKKVWNEILKIKYGKTKSYGEIAKKTKLSPRFVGKICGQNKLVLIIPCHRVMRADGNLGGYSAKGGIKLKKKLLKFEKL
tara:strand:+ start:125 stop:574 length:450 start_codon:yes stop_codon:yes gene_type:complete